MKWENPPLSRKHHRGGKVWADEAAELRAHPGTWGILAECPLAKAQYARQLAYAVKTGGYVAFRPEGAFDAVSRAEENVVKVYAICYETEDS